MKYLVILNPTSGRGYAETVIPKIEESLSVHGLDFEIKRTERPWHAAELAEEAAKNSVDVLVSASGDGTANEVLNGLMRARTVGYTQTAMGILPVGTGNDFAYGMGLPDDLDKACAALAENKRMRIDVGMVKGGDYPEGRYFGNGVGIGFDAAVGFEAEKVTWTRGLLAYLIAAMRTVFLYYNAPSVEMSYDGKTITQPSLMISIMNGQRMGGGFYMAPESSPTDGELDLCIVSEASKLRIFQLINFFLSGTQAGQAEVTTGRTKKISARAVQGTLPAHCDGETLCYEGQQLDIEIIPQTLEFITA
ncbi:MAG: diacylglycerol kinase family lipid kinase [Anaerolineae bacterium]|jgi:diacylglycerol kinase (ATP)|nr:diacylglycerol kinase family lipid kinase [Anaerolineae bacterium]MBT7072642.1 diacylglycerol kinase family lipid kinase [Anaerolineae bacterium]MBT7324872.1 diacylglycerol kinase family lipid kinase [Anaerolineae bacterium]